MAEEPDVARMVKEKNIPALESAMRFGSSARVRLKAVKAAGRLGSYNLVEALNRALREDPNEDVQREAYQALTEILGNRAEGVISSYNSGPVYEDEWLLEETGEEGEFPPEWKMDSPGGLRLGLPNLARIVESQDVIGLEEAIRYGPDVKVRQLAVRAAGQWGNLEIVEALVRSMQEDPEDLVRKEAYEALFEILGNRTEQVAASYNAGADYEDEWIISDPQVEEEGGELSGKWDESSINTLYMMAGDHRDVAKGVKAVAALAEISSTRAVEALISLSLNSPIEKIKLEAQARLEGFYGDDLEEVLNSYRMEGQDELEDYEDVTAGDEMEEEDPVAEGGTDWVELPQRGASLRQAPPESPSVFQEEGLSAVHILLVGVATLVVIGLVAMALGR
ncbi:MAG: HEAT repeat domain-containing protein [Anaerolineaceae bacterium]